MIRPDPGSETAHRRVDDGDLPRGGGGDVNRIVARPRATDHLELRRGGDHPRRHRAHPPAHKRDRVLAESHQRRLVRLGRDLYGRDLLQDFDRRLSDRSRGDDSFAAHIDVPFALSGRSLKVNIFSARLKALLRN